MQPLLSGINQHTKARYDNCYAFKAETERTKHLNDRSQLHQDECAACANETSHDFTWKIHAKECVSCSNTKQRTRKHQSHGFEAELFHNLPISMNYGSYIRVAACYMAQL